METMIDRLNSALEGRYLIERELGEGGMATVFLAEDVKHHRKVAVKVLKPELAAVVGAERFLAEIKTTANLQHPHILPLFDSGEADGLLYYVMPYVEGESLRDRLDRETQLSIEDATLIAAEVADALSYAHDRDVIHRDIKPANLIYNPKEGSLKISDFGVARITDNNRTKTGIVLGTPMYMSPEQLGAENLTGLSDLFSLGVTLYELLVGEVPFRASNIAVLMTKITTEEPAPVSSRRAGIPPSVDAVLAKAMAKNPSRRFSCGAEMAIALRNCARVS